MEEKEKEFIKKVNLDKAKKKTRLAIPLIIISILTYVMPLLVGEFDFGLIFELLSLLFLVLARTNMGRYDEIKSKRYIILTMIPIGWLLIYDFLALCSSVTNGYSFVLIGYEFYVEEILFIIYMFILFAINKDIAKADNPEKYKESTDWFYERYSEKDTKDFNK